MNVNLIMERTEEGIDIIQFYKNRKKLMPEQRKLLVKLIVDYLMTFKSKQSNKKIGELSKQIAMIFPTEEKVNL